MTTAGISATEQATIGTPFPEVDIEAGYWLYRKAYHSDEHDEAVPLTAEQFALLSPFAKSLSFGNGTPEPGDSIYPDENLLPSGAAEAAEALLDRIEQDWPMANLRLSELDAVAVLDDQHVVVWAIV
jgi:hypothetical protein